MPLNASRRAADMEMFEFGQPERWVDTSGRDRLGGATALHVQCLSRIVDGGRIVVGYNDMRDPPAGVSTDDWNPNGAPLNHRDELLGAYFGDPATARIVIAATTRPSGDLRIDLDDGTALEVLPMSIAADDEYWRLFDRDGPHAVGGGGMALAPGRSGVGR